MPIIFKRKPGFYFKLCELIIKTLFRKRTPNGIGIVNTDDPIFITVSLMRNYAHAAMTLTIITLGNFSQKNNITTNPLKINNMLMNHNPFIATPFLY